MIFKSDLIEATNSLNDDVSELFKAVNDLESRLDRVEQRMKRPAGAKSKTQPRDKSGKFVKK